MRFGAFVPQGWRLDLAGLAYAIVYFADAAYDPSSMELFAEKVIPELR